MFSTVSFTYSCVFTHAECTDDRFMCSNGLINGHQPPCISTDQRCDGVIDCIGGEDELDHNCPCEPEGAVRLVDGTVPYRGRVEFCKSGWWSTICSYYGYIWDNSDAAVVCHQLGYPREGMHHITAHNVVLCMLVAHITGAEAHRGKFPGAHISQPIVFDYFYCRGSENNLLECGHGIGRVCQHSADVSVICSGSLLMFVKQIKSYISISLHQNVQKSLHFSA